MLTWPPLRWHISAPSSLLAGLPAGAATRFVAHICTVAPGLLGQIMEAQVGIYLNSTGISFSASSIRPFKAE